MANMMDYLIWRGDLDMGSVTWCDVDGLILASFCYNDLSSGAQALQAEAPLRELAPQLDLMARTGNQYFLQWRALLYAMAEGTRFGGMRVHHYENVVDSARETQFSALTCDLDDGSAYVAFRGTDSTLVGWREDFNMSYESPVPAQNSAVAYLEAAAARAPGPLRVGGHSKGGNLAAYAAAHVSQAVQKRLISVYSFDGPGLDDATIASPGYEHIRPVLRSIIPQSSIVGLLMNYHANYTVVRAKAVSILAHDAFTWQVQGPRFVPAGLTDASRLLDETVHEWLKKCTPDQRKVFVDALFEILSATDATTTTELSGDKLRSAAAMLAATRGMDTETRRMFLLLIGRFLSIGASNVLGLVAERQRERIAGLEDKLHPGA